MYVGGYGGLSESELMELEHSDFLYNHSIVFLTENWKRNDNSFFLIIIMTLLNSMCVDKL